MLLLIRRYIYLKNIFALIVLLKNKKKSGVCCNRDFAAKNNKTRIFSSFSSRLVLNMYKSFTRLFIFLFTQIFYREKDLKFIFLSVMHNFCEILILMPKICSYFLSVFVKCFLISFPRIANLFFPPANCDATILSAAATQRDS